ncbi:MAG: hypothetical protein ABIE94_00895 [archaeon]
MFHGWEGGRSFLSLILGLIVLALGLIPFLNAMGVIGFGLPAFLTNAIAQSGIYVLAGVGFYLLIDGFMEEGPVQVGSIIVALAIVAIGIVNIFLGYKISFLGPMVYNVIFSVVGILLIIGAWHMR